MINSFQFIGFTDIGSAWTGTNPFSRTNGFNTNVYGGGTNPFQATVTDFRNPFFNLLVIIPVIIPVVKIMEPFTMCKTNIPIGVKLLRFSSASLELIMYHAIKIYSSAPMLPVKIQTQKLRLSAESAMIMKYMNTGGKYSA